jgi:hypothetical protein
MLEEDGTHAINLLATRPHGCGEERHSARHVEM